MTSSWGWLMTTRPEGGFRIVAHAVDGGVIDDDGVARPWWLRGKQL